MIRLRTMHGTVEVVEKPHSFVEVCDNEGKVNIVLYKDQEGFVHILRDGDVDFHRYKKIMKL